MQSWEVNKHTGNGEGREDCDVSSDILIPFSLPLGLSMPFACCPVHLCGTCTLLSLAVGSIPSTAAARHFMGMCLSECLPGACLWLVQLCSRVQGHLGMFELCGVTGILALAIVIPIKWSMLRCISVTLKLPSAVMCLYYQKQKAVPSSWRTRQHNL